MENVGILLLIIALIAIGFWFAIVTAMVITNALGVTGIKWWIVFITLLGALGGCGGSLINIRRD